MARKQIKIALTFTWMQVRHQIFRVIQEIQ